MKFVENILDCSTIFRLSRLESLSHVCDPHLFQEPNLTNSLSSLDPVSNLLDIAVPLEDFSLVCKWRNKLVDCSGNFKEIVTEEGVCFTFNSLHPLDIVKKTTHSSSYEKYTESQSNLHFHVEKSYLSDSVIKTYPHRALGTGIRTGLIIVLQQYNVDTDYLCKGPVQGFKVAIHSPAELPSFSDYIRVPLKRDISVGVEAHVKSTAKSLRSHNSKM